MEAVRGVRLPLLGSGCPIVLLWWDWTFSRDTVDSHRCLLGHIQRACTDFSGVISPDVQFYSTRLKHTAVASYHSDDCHRTRTSTPGPARHFLRRIIESADRRVVATVRAFCPTLRTTGPPHSSSYVGNGACPSVTCSLFCSSTSRGQLRYIL